MNFGELARVTGGRLASGDPAAPAPSFAFDSRKFAPGEVFVALKGERSDGHDFVADVLSRGAGGAVVERLPPGLPSGAPVLVVPDAIKALQDAARDHRARMTARVVGVTGSNGKTTTKEMVAAVLAAGGKSVLSTQGNLNSRVGLPLMVWRLSPAHSHAVFEMGASAKGDIAALASVARPDVGVLTNMGRAHVETFGSVEGVADGKWELVESLPAAGLAVLNADDARMAARRPRAKVPVVTYGLSPAADVRAEDLRQDPEVRFTLRMDGKKSEARLPVAGLFNVHNALAAAAVGWREGVGIEDILRGLAGFKPAAQRMQVRRGRRGALFVVDAYNANPDSMRASLESFAVAHGGRRKIAVLGGMRELGSSAAAEHRALGALAAGLALDEVHFLGDEGTWVREGWPAGAKPALSCWTDKDSLRRALEKVLSPESVFLFKASRSVRMEDVYEPLVEEA